MSGETRPVFGTVSLYEALARDLNADPVWREMATPITYTMIYHYLEPIDARFFLRFDHGEIVDVRDVAADEDLAVDFTISAKPAVWEALIRLEMQPTAAMATGKVKVKGRQTVLLRHMKRFSYLIDRLCHMDPVFP
jgi:ubiquinone biosynthesis protein UbiJ